MHYDHVLFFLPGVNTYKMTILHLVAQLGSTTLMIARAGLRVPN